ncbi:MAG: hypothetical protein HUJ69_06950 [Lachnospiraceae bacterium]|nr:hypothetical protein [Lachnospiraceae bacterium]
MSKKYKQIMENVVVTEAMEQRILKNIAAETAPKARMIAFPHWKNYAAIAACLILVLAGALLLPKTSRAPGGKQDSGVMLVSPLSGDLGSAEALAAQVGFSVSDISTLPFEPSSAAYQTVTGNIAQITYYSGEAEAALFRKAQGSEDISGNYETYADQLNLTVGNIHVTLQGSEGSYVLATWTDASFAYSLHLAEGCSSDLWEEMISAIR